MIVAAAFTHKSLATCLHSHRHRQVSVGQSCLRVRESTDNGIAAVRIAKALTTKVSARMKYRLVFKEVSTSYPTQDITLKTDELTLGTKM